MKTTKKVKKILKEVFDYKDTFKKKKKDAKKKKKNKK